MFCYTRIILTLIIISFLASNSLAQVKQSDLVTLLPASEQQKISKAENNLEKGRNLEAEADKIKSSGSNDKEMAKNEKKYNLKRLEASQYYQKGNYDLFAVLKDNVSEFWKKNKNGIIQPDIKNKEDKANELFRRAKSLRKVAEDLTYPDEKLVKILEAEDNEREAIETMVKVLYAYINNPIAYDTLKPQYREPVSEVAQNKEEAKPKDSVILESKDTSLLQKKEPVQSAQNKDTSRIASVELQQVTVVAPKDTVSKTKLQPVKPVNSEPVKIADKPDLKPNKNSASEKDTSSLYNMVSINEDQVDMFNKFLQTEYPKDYENYIIDFQKLDYSNVDSMKTAWYKYLYANREETKSIAKRDSSLKDSVKVALAETQNQKNSVPPSKNSSKPADKKKKPDNTKQTKAPEVPVRENLEPSVPATGFVFRVQISACRISMDQQSLKSIYNGEINILELQEDGWYKYAIGEFNTYKQARQLRDKIKVPGAFVIAYLNGKRIKILTSMTAHQEYTDISAKETVNVSDLVFKVQIAASKVPLKKNYIDNIYSGSQPVEEINEDGWYKYTIAQGNSFKEAKNFVEKENIPGAFITAYYKGNKIELKEALRLIRKNRQN